MEKKSVPGMQLNCLRISDVFKNSLSSSVEKTQSDKNKNSPKNRQEKAIH